MVDSISAFSVSITPIPPPPTLETSLINRRIVALSLSFYLCLLVFHTSVFRFWCTPVDGDCVERTLFVLRFRQCVALCSSLLRFPSVICFDCFIAVDIEWLRTVAAVLLYLTACREAFRSTCLSLVTLGLAGGCLFTSTQRCDVLAALDSCTGDLARCARAHKTCVCVCG